MKFLVLIAFIAFVSAGGYVAVKAIAGDFSKGISMRKRNRLGWRVVPSTNPANGRREIRLRCPGEDDFIFYKEPEGEIFPHKWDEKLLDAEFQANEFNRLRRQGMQQLC